MNIHIIMGRVGQDPELQQLPSGSSVCNLSVATDEVYTDNNGERQKRTTWHRVAFFGRTAESVAKYVRKGRAIAVEGSIRRREYEDNDGIKREAVDTIGRVWRFAGSPNEGTRNGGNGNGNGRNRQQRSRGGGSTQNRGRQQPQRNHGHQAPPADDFDDVPF